MKFKGMLSSSLKVSLTTIIVVGVSSTAHSQSGQAAAGSAASQPSSDAAPGYGEIIVTAERRSQSLTRVAASISAFSSQAIEQRGLTTLGDIQAAVPAINLGSSLGSAQVSIRGVGLTINTGAGEPGVAVHLDGIYEARSVLASLAQFDLERIEVLKGPQGTLYGRNATGGAINFISKAPTETFEGRVKAGYANYDEYHLDGVVSGPISDKIRARVGVTYNNQTDGFIKNDLPGQPDAEKSRDIGVRAKIAADITEDFVATAGFLYLDKKANTGGFVPVGPINPVLQSYNPALQVPPFRYGPTRTAQFSPRLDRHAYQPSLTLDWSVGDIGIKSLSSFTYVKSDALIDGDSVAGNIILIGDNWTSKQFTQELTVSGQSDRLDWIIGGFFLREKFDHSQPAYYNNTFFLDRGPPIGIIPVRIGGTVTIQDGDEKRTSYANFADLTFALTDTLKLKGGARYSIDTVDMDQTHGTSTNLECQNLMSDATFKSFTPKIGLQFEPDSANNIYATISKGYKSGGINFGTCGDTFKPESILAYEIGYKGRALDNALTFALAAYWYDYSDLQVYQVRPLILGGGTFIDNAPKARIRGLEGEITVTPNRHWSFNAAAAYLDATYREYSNIDSSNARLGVQNLRGNRITRSPKLTGNVGLQYTTGEFDGVGTFTIRGDVYHSSSFFFTEFNTPADHEKGYELVNGSVSFKSVGDRFEVRIYGKNLTNKRYANFLTRSPLIGGNAVSYGNPRQYGVELITRF